MELHLSNGPELKHLSPSKVSTGVEKCMLRLRWELDYKEQGISIPSSYFMLGGRALHKMIELALKGVIAGRPLPSEPECVAMTQSAWETITTEEESKGTPIDEDPDDPKEGILRDVLALSKLVRTDLLPNLKPKRVEHTFKETIQNGDDSFIVWGQIDYQDEDGTILDWKTTAEVSANAKKRDVQMRAYAWWDGRVNRTPFTQIQKVFLCRGGKGKIVPHKYNPPIQPFERQLFESDAIAVWRSARAGHYVPNTSSFWCSEKFCPFYGPCRGGA